VSGDHFRSVAPHSCRDQGALPIIAWKGMAGAGNIYRHNYEDVAAKLVWDTVQLALPPLRDVVARELAAVE
jgi:uncharacterized protein with HEPN domain